MKVQVITWSALAVTALAAGVSAAETAFKPLAPPANPAALGANVQRTMTLLATSTAQKRNRVRILFYGQSVTRNPWWQEISDYLRTTYPHADLEIENRAIGGYGANVLIHTAEHDLYPFYPDLMIFHVYGGVKGGEQEKIIAKLRRTTTSEVLLWTSHFRWPRNLPRDGDPNDAGAQKLTSSDEERSQMIRDIAAKHGCELAEVREQIRRYLKDNELFPKDTLRDSVHPNKLGNYLIGGFIRPHLRHDPAFSREPWTNLVTEVSADDERVTRNADGSFEMTFDGNRVDIVAAACDGKPGTAKVLIDGQPPSAFPELYYHTRPSNAPHDHVRPAINRIDHKAALVQEKWTAKILECDPEKNVLTYEVSGSKTGPDGQGDHFKEFVSNSGRVVIPARKWMVCWAVKYRKKPLPPDFTVTWEAKALFKDTYEAPVVDDVARDHATMVAQGLNNAPHVLKIIPNGDGPVPIQAFRVYRPPLK